MVVLEQEEPSGAALDAIDRMIDSRATLREFLLRTGLPEAEMAKEQ
jgi:hypothetical protein